MTEWNPDPVERAIQAAQEAGEFDDLPGSGRPIPGIDRPYDPAWWVRNWVERDRADAEVRELSARLRREVPQAVGLEDAAEARARLEALNQAIDRVNAQNNGSIALARVDVDRLLQHFTD